MVAPTWVFLVLGTLTLWTHGAPAHTSLETLSAEEVNEIRERQRVWWNDANERCAASTEGIGRSALGGVTDMLCTDGSLLQAMTFVYEDPQESGVFLDGGAHVGRWTARVLTSFGALEARKYSKEFGNIGDRCPHSVGHMVTIFCVEPLQANFDRLKDRAKRSAWQLEDVQFMRAGLSNSTTKAQIWSTKDQVDSAASMSLREGRDVVSTTEKMVTVDVLLKKTIAQGKVFLLRLAINGHEAAGLLGAGKSLKKRLVRFVLFEMSASLWEDAGYRLANSVKALWKVGYACFALLPKPTILSGPFWDLEAIASGPPLYQVLCGHVDDVGLRRVVQILDPDVPEVFGRVKQ